MKSSNGEAKSKIKGMDGVVREMAKTGEETAVTLIDSVMIAWKTDEVWDAWKK